jgi:hypothetical protein
MNKDHIKKLIIDASSKKFEVLDSMKRLSSEDGSPYFDTQWLVDNFLKIKPEDGLRNISYKLSECKK